MGGRQAVFACFLASFAFLTLLYDVLTAESWPVAKVLPSVVKITVEFQGKPGSCTAFSVDEAQGRFVTAKHCATGTVSIGFVPLAQVDEDASADLVLLQTREGGLPGLKVGGAPRPGDATLAIGYPLSSPKPMLVPTLYQGPFDAFNQGHDVATFSGNSMPGMSGGPIVNTRGEVVSVVLGGGNPSQVFQNVGFGAKHAALARLVRKWRED